MTIKSTNTDIVRTVELQTGTTLYRLWGKLVCRSCFVQGTGQEPQREGRFIPESVCSRCRKNDAGRKA